MADTAKKTDEAGTPADAKPPASKPADKPADKPDARAAGEVRGGRLADLADAPVMPPGVPYAIAREPLYVSNPEAAAAPVRAFNPGDRVPAELVEKFGWGELTEIPEWAPAPPAPAPESSEEHK